MTQNTATAQPQLPATPTQAQAAPAINNAQQSALQALGGFAPPESVTPQPTAQSSSATQPQQPSFAGNWTANLNNGARVQLLLQADGSFSWTAINKDGQNSTFQGTYILEAGQLSLSRNTDGQKLVGNFSNSGNNNFSFKLADNQASSLEFVRG